MNSSTPSTYIVHQDTATIQITVSDTTAENAFEVPNTEVVRLEDGTYDFNKVESQGPILLHWQKYIGEYVAQSYLKLPNARTKQWRAPLPEGYVLFSKCKSISVEKSSEIRHDQYLKGPNPKFRSPREFVPHYLWLLQNGHNGSGAQCICKYCGPGRNQRDINKQLGLPEPKKSSKATPATRVVIKTGRNGLYTVTQ